MSVQSIAVLWPDEANYARFVAVCGDGIKHATVEEYHAAARKNLDQFSSGGVPVKFVSFDPDELVIWAKAQGMSVNSQSRAQYAAFLQMQSDLADEKN